MKIIEVSTFLGEDAINLNDIYQIPGLVEKTGIKTVFETKSTTVDLASNAVMNLSNTNFDAVDAMFLVTQSPDDFLPANAISLANRILLPKTVLTMDLNQGCSGFVQAFTICAKLLNYYKNILLVTADRYRSKCKPTDRSTNAVFSDGATATLLSNEGNYSVLYEDHFTAGEYRNLLFQSTGSENDGHIHMAGADIWLFTKREVVPQINQAIEYCSNNQLKIKGVYIHQASKLVVDGIKNLLNIEDHKLFENYFNYGNTVSSTIPFLIKDFPIDLDSDEVVIFAGFGVGLTSSVIIYGNKS
jgi:3-oxoacyl-[acyl-carrier-protein] synthase-3